MMGANFDLSLCSHKLCVKVFAPLFSKRGRGFGARSPVYGISLLLAFLFVPLVSKRKAAKELECVQNSIAAKLFSFLSHFFFASRSRKEKVRKKKRRFSVGSAHNPRPFEKGRSKLPRKVRANTAINPNLMQKWVKKKIEKGGLQNDGFCV